MSGGFHTSLSRFHCTLAISGGEKIKNNRKPAEVVSALSKYIKSINYQQATLKSSTAYGFQMHEIFQKMQ